MISDPSVRVSRQARLFAIGRDRALSESPSGSLPKSLQSDGRLRQLRTRQLRFELLRKHRNPRKGAGTGFWDATLTMYKPNFCSECGAKLLRLRWHLWTSRRFCNDCARRLRKARFGPVLLTTLALLGAGYVAGRVRRPAPPPLVIERRSDSPLSDKEPLQSTPANSGVNSSATSSTSVEEVVYLCGARTKKGTPCSRRVHGPVRCWQHKGMPAMLPQEKLVVR